jgi:hypothetical protein
LSHFNYSAPLLASASQADKNETKALQKRLLRIIGINASEALNDHNITDIEELIEKAALNKIKKVLSDQHHPLCKKYTRTHPRSGELVHKTPRAKTEHYRSSIVPYSIHVIRDGKASLYAEAMRASAKRQLTFKKTKKAAAAKKAPVTREAAVRAIITKQPQPATMKTDKQASSSNDTSCPHCATTKRFIGIRGLNVHLRTCLLKPPTTTVSTTGVFLFIVNSQTTAGGPKTK